ncbi:MAG: phosphoglycerate kinase [Acidobacteria bacterium]|nr:phosphoglycerate kinase [Acidobacteriota bacterium]
MAKLTLEELELGGKRVFVRVDFNVPIKESKITDDLRIREALPTIRYCIEQGALVVLASHLGRPKGKVRPEFSLAPVARRLEELLGRSVRFAGDCVGPEAEQAVAASRPGDVVLLENLRFHPGEEAGDPGFARELAARTPLYVNDAFGCAHRAHASVTAIARFVDRAAAGFLMEKELRYLGGALEAPDRPFVAILGGAKISDKIDVIENLLGKVDRLLVGGAMMFTFLRSQGKKIGRSLCEEDKLDLARSLVGRAGEGRLMLPVDAVASGGIEDGAGAHTVPAGEIPDGEMGLDIGPRTLAMYAEAVRSARTIVWNGPMGVFEREAFASGTMGLARAVADSAAVSIVGGGDSAAAVVRAGVADRITHISTGGGASLEFLAGRVLPGVAALNDRQRTERP